MLHFLTNHWRKLAVIGMTLLVGLFISCNVEPEVEHRIDLALHDSLSKDKGGYDSLQISILSDNGKVIQPLVFRGPYEAGKTGGVLKGLLLGSSVPPEFTIDIKAFKGGDTVHVNIQVKDKVPGAIVRIDTVKIKPPVVRPGDSDTVIINPPTDPKTLVLNESVLILGITGLPRQVYAKLLPDGATGLIRFSISDSLIATVDINGIITPRAVGETQVIAQVDKLPQVSDTLLVKVILPPAITQVAFARSAGILYVGAPSIKLKVTHLPDTLTPMFEFKSSDPGTIEVNTLGEVIAKAEGFALITVNASGSTGIRDTITLRGLRDAPIIDAGQTQSVAVGQAVNIKVKVTQAFGTLNLTWDFNADGKPEGSTTLDTATATHTYSTQGEYLAVFTAKDEEGNATTQTVRIRVGKAGPLVIITSPKQDTLVNTPRFTVQYTTDGTPKSQVFNLLVGTNTLVVKDSNTTGTDMASVKVTLDTKAPVVKITSPQNGAITNSPEVDVAWSVDSVAKTTGIKENLVGKQGPITFYRDFTDSAGNRGRDSITITRDTVPPAIPTFNLTLSSPSVTNNKRLTWVWASSGISGGGNGNFRWSVNTPTPATGAGLATQFSSPTELPDGTYLLTFEERDAAGNWSSPVTREVRVLTSGALVAITSPLRGSYFNVRSGVINITWEVNSANQLSDTNHTLTQEGVWNRIRREFRDVAGNISFDTVSVFWDTTAPTAPTFSVKPQTPARTTSSSQHTWTWGNTGIFEWHFSTTSTLPTGSGTANTTGSYSRTGTLTDGIHYFRVRERDAAGNWSTWATEPLFIDNAIPGAPSVSVSPTSPTRNQTPTWKWSSGTAATGDFRYKLNDANLISGATETRATEFTYLPGLAEGTWVLYVQERNAAGSWSSNGFASIRIDTTRPRTPTVSVSPASPTLDRRPIWSWNKQEAGLGLFRYRLNSASPRDTGATSFRPSATSQLTEGTYTVYVQESDSAGNWSAEGSAQIAIDLTPPTAPSVNGPATPTNDDTPTWTWVAGTGGNRNFRYRLNDTNMVGGTPTTDLFYTPPSQAAGIYTLYVQERDDAGNWSARGSYNLTVDLSPPNAPSMNTTTPRSPLNTLRPTWSWSSGGGGGANTYQVKVGNDDFSNGATIVSGTSYPWPTNLPQGAQTLFVRERDAAQNWSTTSSRTLFLSPRAPLGGLGFSVNQGTTPKILITSNGDVYAAFDEEGVISVKRFQPSSDSWIDAGTGLGLNNVLDFALAPGDVPYIVGYSSEGTHVKRLNGSAWQNVGNPTTNALYLSGSYHSLDFTSTGTPFLAFKQYDENFTTPYSIKLMRYSGTQWDLANMNRVGTDPWYLDLAFGANNRPYIAYQDLSGLGVYVITTDPSNYTANWDTLGSGPAFHNSIALGTGGLKVKTHSNQIYLGISASTDGIQVLTSSGGGFTSIHTTTGSDFDLTVSPTGNPYLALVKLNSPFDQITVMGRINSTWINVGGVLQSSGGMLQPSLAVTGDGVPYVGFYDQAAGGKPSVIRTSFDP